MPTERVNIIISAQDQTKQAFRSADRGMTNLRKSINAHGTSIKFAAAGAAFAIGSFANQSVKDASNLEESINAVQVTFGDAADEIFKFGQTAVETAGLSRRAVNQAAVPIGAQLQNMGFAANEAADETINLTKRAADMASVFNEDVEDVLLAIQSGLRGQTEPLTRFGVDLTEAQVRSVALSEGIIEVDRELTQQEKTLARVAALYKQTDKVQGDFKNTSDSHANSMRILNQRFENVRAELGVKLIPIFNAFITFLEGPGLTALSNFIVGIEVVADAFDSVTTAISRVMIAMDQLKARIPGVKGAVGGLIETLGNVTLGPVGGLVGKGIFDRFFQDGGVVPGSGPQPVVAHGGEMILNSEQQRRMFDMLNQPKRNVTNNVNVNAQMQSGSDIGGLAEQLGARISMNPRFQGGL